MGECHLSEQLCVGEVQYKGGTSPAPLAAITGDQHQLPCPGEALGKRHTTLSWHWAGYFLGKIWGINGGVLGIIRTSFRGSFTFVCCICLSYF